MQRVRSTVVGPYSTAGIHVQAAPASNVRAPHSALSTTAHQQPEEQPTKLHPPNSSPGRRYPQPSGSLQPHPGLDKPLASPQPNILQPRVCNLQSLAASVPPHAPSGISFLPIMVIDLRSAPAHSASGSSKSMTARTVHIAPTQRAKTDEASPSLAGSVGSSSRCRV